MDLISVLLYQKTLYLEPITVGGNNMSACHRPFLPKVIWSSSDSVSIVIVSHFVSQCCLWVSLWLESLYFLLHRDFLIFLGTCCFEQNGSLIWGFFDVPNKEGYPWSVTKQRLWSKLSRGHSFTTFPHLHITQTSLQEWPSRSSHTIQP